MPGFEEWESFYVIVGAAFSSPNVVHFSAALLLSALMRVPWHGIGPAALLWGTVGFAGTLYIFVVARRMRAVAGYRADWEDWTYHAFLPLVAYVLLLLSAFAARWHAHESLLGVATATLLQLFIGIHNSWDTVSYHVLVRARRAKD
jgi:hypothetical protein